MAAPHPTNFITPNSFSNVKTLSAMMWLAQQNLKEEKTDKTTRNKEEEKKRKPTNRTN
jgi:hypothetical protein